MPEFNPETDLEIARVIRSAPETIWRCWAEPELFKQWFTPPGVEVTDCENVLEPGGRAYTVMKLPDGSQMPLDGCFLLADFPRRLVYTDAMVAGFRPKGEAFMCVDVTLTPVDGGTRYHAHVMHPGADQRQAHLDMGFEEGWGTTFEQLDRLAAGLEAG
ncbi:MAG: SRPBCC domain-containing protein [Paracoccaceae bacterium]|nr:SRPBCC domain-containing protein [Paracoccaceae bacterium]